MTARSVRSDVSRSFGALDDAALLDTVDVAKIVGVTRHCVRNWRRTPPKGPPYVVIGRLVRYKVGDLRRWIAAHAPAAVAAE